MEGIKTSKEVLDEFFNLIQHNKDLDDQTVDVIKTLHEEDKLTKTNIINALDEVRENHED